MRLTGLLVYLSKLLLLSKILQRLHNPWVNLFKVTWMIIITFSSPYNHCENTPSHVTRGVEWYWTVCRSKSLLKIQVYERLTSRYRKSPDSSATSAIHFVSIRVEERRKQWELTMQVRWRRESLPEWPERLLNPLLPKLQFQGLYTE